MASNKPQVSNPPSVPEPPPTYSQVCVTPIVSSSKLVTLAGQAGFQEDGTVASETKAQAKATYENVLKCLEAVGATPRDIVQVRHYIVKETGDNEQDAKDIADRGWGEEWIAFMDHNAAGHRPPDTVVGVACLAKKEFLYECEVTALVS